MVAPSAPLVRLRSVQRERRVLEDDLTPRTVSRENVLIGLDWIGFVQSRLIGLWIVWLGFGRCDEIAQTFEGIVLGLYKFQFGMMRYDEIVPGWELRGQGLVDKVDLRLGKSGSVTLGCVQPRGS